MSFFIGCTCGGVYVPYILACQVGVTVGDSDLLLFVCVTSFERQLTPLYVDCTHYGV